MDSFDPTLDFILERARPTRAIMTTLAAAPYNFQWDGISPNNFQNMIDGVDTQVEALAEGEAGTTDAAAFWDQDLDLLIADAALGTRLGRVKYADDAVKLRHFELLRYPNSGRNGRYLQALGFEKAWKKVNPAWVFKTGLTQAQFKTRRLAIVGREEAHVEAITDERNERALLHSMADAVNQICVKWYDVATATYGSDTVAGQLIRTIPTTYDPNRVPGRLRFTAHLSAAPNHGHLIWRAARGHKFYILARRPGAPEYELILDGVTDNEWMGLGLMPGVWSIKGYATNQFGQGEESEVVTFTVAAAQAA
jgi:hypothetical protein